MTIDNQQSYWDSVAERKTFTHPIDITLIGSLVSKDAAILDFGCGYGRIVKILGENGFGNVSGCDSSIELIKRGKQNGTNGLFFINHPNELQLVDNSVDCIILFAVLTCIPSNSAQSELVKLLLSKLRSGGIIYISDYYLQEVTVEVNRYEYLNGDKNNFGVFVLPEGATFRHHTPEWIATLLQEFSVIHHSTVEVKTMNGNSAKAFQIIARK